MFKLCVIGDLGFEFWKDIPEYEGLYQASTYGRVRGVQRFRRINGGSQLLPEKIKKQTIQKDYPFVNLCKNGVPHRNTVHFFIASTFLPKWKAEYTQINHKNENKTDNRVENLEWCTSQYNINYGNRNSKVSKKLTNGKLSKSVLQFDLQGTLIKQYPSTKEIERQTGYANQHISDCCIGKYKTAYGYIWRYA